MIDDYSRVHGYCCFAPKTPNIIAPGFSVRVRNNCPSNHPHTLFFRAGGSAGGRGGGLDRRR
jgi:hypothetical protein